MTSYEFMLVHGFFRVFVCMSLTNFSHDLLVIFWISAHQQRSRSKEKSDRSRFSRKIFVCTEMGKKGPQLTKIKFLLSFHKILSLLLLKVSKIERCYNSLFSCAKNTSGLQFIRQNSLTLIQSDCRIFLSSISLEVMRQCNFLHGDTHQRKVAHETIIFG